MTYAKIPTHRGEDSGGPAGWSIFDHSHRKLASTNAWTATSGSAIDPLRLKIVGTVNANTDTTAPSLNTATVDGTSLVLTYDEALDTSSEPATSAYSVSVAGGTGTAPSSVNVSGMTVTLTLGTAVTAGQTVTVTYTVPMSNPVQDAAGNDAAALTNQSVTNNTNAPPVFARNLGFRSIPETVAATTVQTAATIGAAFTATDADNDTLTYTLEGTNAGKFSIVSGTSGGQITTKVGQSYDYETRTSYTVTLKADDNNGGSDTISVIITITNNTAEIPLVPAAPAVSATAGSTTSLDVTWTAPANTGRPTITGYALQYRKGTSGTWTDGPQDQTGTRASISSLDANSAYQVQVRATNADGDSESGRNEAGNSQGTGNCSSTAADARAVWPGSNDNGTGKSNAQLGKSLVAVGALSCGRANPLGGGRNLSVAHGRSQRLYALSPVIKLIDEVAVQSVSIPSTPANATSGYAAGETIRVRLDFGEAVSVAGSPYLMLDIAGAARRAVYASGAGTRYLNFEYTVQAGDFDSNGVSLCSSRLLDPGCGRLSLGDGRISAQSDGLAAELDLPDLGNQSDHKVDGMPNFTPNPGVGPMPGPTTGVVPRNWPLKPAAVDFGGRFRLLFVPSATRAATSTDINDYNQHVIDAAGAGHSAIQGYKGGFRVIASTEAVDARDNAGLTGTGAPIYWLGSNNKVADDYADLLDGSWDDESNRKTETGNASSAQFVWTGSNDNGTEGTKTGAGQTFSVALGTDDEQRRPAFGALNVSNGNPLQAGTSSLSTLSPLYAHSQVLRVPPPATRQDNPDGGLEPTSRPRKGDTYRLGETFIFPFVFTEPVVVRGVPTMPLKLDSGTVRARYVSESGTNSGSGTDARATAASVSSSPSSGSTYGAGETITVSLAMSEAVLVTGRPYVVLDVGGVRRRAVYAGPIGSATDVLDFDYTVQAGDFDTDGVALCGRGAGCGRIALDGGSIRASYDGSVASLGHPALGAQSGHKADAAAALTLMPPTACANEIRVPDDWPLTPSGVSAGGKFRLLFVTSTVRTALSSNIADYNRFVQNRAAAGHSSIRPYKDGFRAVGSTDAADARDNTCTTGTGVEIHWLNGNKVADDYADFYDDSWDDPNLKNEGGNGITGSSIQVFTGSGADGTAAADHYLGVASPNTAVIAIMPSTVRPLASHLGDVRGTRRFYGLSQVFKVPAASDRAHTTDIAIISSPAIGDAYRLGETVEVEVTYSEAVSVRGTPHIGLSVKNATGNADNEYDAPYVSGSGTAKLVFAFTVPGGLKDDDGIQLYSDTLRLNGARIATVSDGSSAVWTLAAWRNIGGKADTSLPLSGGVCDRTPAVRYAIVAAVTAASDCSQVTEAHLAGMTGTLEVRGLTSLAAGDLAGLSGLGILTLYGSGIETLPVGLFDGLDSLTRLRVETQLTHLPKDIFRGLGKVRDMLLDGLFSPPANRNRLREGGLPDGIFEPLSRDVKLFWIFGSPGSDSFRPRAADAGPGGMLSAGQKVTLGGPGNDGGPWGSNVFYRWRQKDGSGNAVSTVALPVTDEVNVVANPSFTVPTLAEATEVRFLLQLDGAGKKLDGSAHGDPSLRLGLYSPVSEARFTILALAPTGVAVVSKPVDGGDTYKGGEKIEVAVTFGDRVLVDTSLGTPTLGLAVGTETRQATYVRGTGTTRLAFEYTVQSSDTDGDGIAVAANGLAPGGGAIASVYGVQALLDHAALAAQTGHKVGGSETDPALTGGICERTPQVRGELVELVKANDSNVSNCSDVTTTHLGALTGYLDLDNKGIAVLKRGDFAGLGGIEVLALNVNNLTALPAGVFEGLDDTLINLFLNDNALQTIAPGVFDGLTGPPLIIDLDRNNLSSLPPRIFEKLTGLTNLALGDNPGSARFVPIAKAGPAGGIEVVSGGSVTLGVEGAENGHDDPWGTNVTWSWSRTGGDGGSLTDAAAARAAFTAPATGEDGTHVFRLTVTGKANFAATADVAIRVAAGPRTVEAAFAPAGGTGYAGGETIEVALHFDRAVTVDTGGGTPSVTLTVGAAPRTAGYLRGSDTRVLTFGYTVQAADMDADGVDLVANSLALNGGKIAAVSDGGLAVLGHAALAGGSGRTVNVAGTGGICDRTPAVQSAILERVRTAENDAGLQCGDITPARLVAIGGRLDLSAQARNGRMTALKAGDFAWLANVTLLDLDNHALRSFPAGVFDPLTALSELSIAYNQTQAADRLRSLPAGLFDRLTKLTALRLEHNDLESLPDGIFGKLTRLATLTLHGNPGSAGFLPVAVAGPAGGLEAETGERVTLGPGSGSGTGSDAGGPWGGNVVHAWRQVSGTAVALSATDAAKPAFAAPALAAPENLVFELTVTGRGTSLTATDRVSVRIAAAAAVSSVVPASTPIDGDTYRRGETIGIAVGFAKPVTVTGTPQLALSVGTHTRQAAYVRGSGTGQLVFEYTVQAGDADSDGIAIAADSLTLAGGGIADADANGMAALLGHPALAAQAAHRVDGSLSHAFNPAAGICGRTAPVRDGLLLAVRARTGDTGLGCAQVTEAHLGALTGTLILAHKGIGTLKPGDFANLGGIAALQLDNNDLTALPAGVFDRLTGLTTLSLHDNRLPSLPSRIFENLTGLTTLSLHGNPGSARFVPVARAGPKGGIEVVQGASVTLGAADAAAGYDDPWGSNVTHSWSQTAGASQGAGNWRTARPSFTAPAADETLAFTLTVAGRGGASSGNVNRHRATSTVGVRVGAAGVRPMPVSAAVNGTTLTLTYGEDLRETEPAPASGKGPVYLAVVSEPGERRTIVTVPVSGARASGRTVTITLEREVVHNRIVTLSYFPDNAVAAGRVRDRAGNLAGGFAGLRVRNVLSEGPVVRDIAFAGAAKTYRIGDTVGIDVTFSDPVSVTATGGAPTLALEIGAAGRKARWKAGQAPGAVQRFEYTVAEGDEDTDGIAVKADGLTVPSGSAILTTAEREAVNLRHGRVHDPARKVDGVRPAVPPSQTVPQIGISPSHCDMSDANELWCATLTAETYEAGGSFFVGYLRSGGYGSVAPDTFTYRGVGVAVSVLHSNRATSLLRFEVGPASGTAPAGGLLGAGSFSLEIGTGAGRKTFAIETPGTRTGFEFPGPGFDWQDRVPVKLVRRGAQATAASISSSPSSGSTYRAGETVTVRLAMNEAVLVTGRPHILLDVGGVRRRAVYSGPIGSSTDVLDFSYTVQAGDFDTDGVALCGRGAGCGRIALDGGSIRAAGDESAASLGHPALAAQSGHKVDAAPLPALSTACADEIRVRIDWALKPSSVSAGGTFRLLFVGSVDRNAQSSNIADYNRFVQSLAAAGHSSIRPFKGGFRAVGSTAAVDARDNTCTTGTGVPIHWLNGNQVADNYADFYDNSWDDQANPKTESGNAIGPRNVWTGSNSDGTNGGQPLGNTPGGGRLIRFGTIGQSGGGGSPLSATSALASSSGSALAFYGLSQVFKVPAASDKARTTDIAIISSPAIGDAYRLGETVEVEVMYSEAVTVRGAPLVGLSVKNATGNDDNEYDAAYVRGSGTTKLVFSFTVPSGLRDDDGIQLYSSPLRLNGATITAVSDGDPAVWNLAAERNIGGKVDSSRTPSGGICSRTPQVRDAIVAAVAAASDCSQVTNAYLTALTGTLEFSGLTSIAAGDLAGLSSLTRLNLYGSGIETLPVGLFDGLGSLTRLDVRAGLTHLPKDIFRGLGKVTFLSLDGLEYPESPGNRLREGGLPDGIFEPLSRDVKSFWIFGSPGSESFRPRAADAGPGGMLSAGQKVTLGGPGNDGGPWGSNVFYRWRQKDGSGNAVSTVALPVTDEVNVVANPSFTVPTLAEATEVRFQLQLDGAGKKLDGGAHGDASLRLGLYSPVSEARFTIRGLAPTGVAVVSKPVDGDTYRQGEKIEVAVTFGDRVLVDTSLGTPALGLAVGTETRQATYVRGTGSNRLVFEYTVQSGDTDGDGIAVAANGLAPGGGAIASVYGVRAILDHAALAAQTGHKVDGSLTHGFDLTGGVCGRTPQVRDKLLELVKANDSNVTDCSKVTAAHLAALTEQLYLDHAGIATLKRGDFAGLGGIEILTLNANDLTALTAGVFEGLDDTLTLLWLGENDLQTIAPGVFDGLKGLTLLQLTDNDLSLLPPRIFEKLTGLDDLFLGQLPGNARFVPTAKAGPAGGIEVVSGGNVTLGVEGAENGFDDPWGTNVTWAWSRTEGAGGMLADDTAARAAFTAPVTGEDGTHVFRLKVIGAGDFAATADVAIRVAAGPKTVEAAFASEPAGGSAYAGGETIEVALRFDRAVNVDTTGGTPSVALTVGAGSRPAGYLRGSGTRALTFGYTVQAADVDADGVDLVANSLALNGGKIAAVSDGGLAALGHTALSGGSGRTVNVAGTPAARGICDRTAAVQTAILERVRADENDASLQCGDIGPVRLVAIGGRLDLSAQARNGRMTALKAGDFAWLANVTVLDLDNHALRSFPAGIFDPLTALSELSIAYNQTQAADRLTSLPAGLFDRLTKLTTLRLEHNDLETLPDGIFEKLTRLTTLTLHGNPGSAAFLPVAAAGPAGGLEAETGERVTLGGDAGGPWGGNVVHAWRQVSGTAVALSATDAAKPAFAAPALAGPEDLAFELTVTGRGTSLTATDRVSVRIAAAAAVSSVVPASTPIDGDTYRRGETIGIAVGFAKPVTVTGTPQLALSVGTNTRQAAYVRGSGTGQLVFEYPVVQADADSDGIAIAADSLAPGTGAIADATGMAALLGHPALAAQAAHRVDGSLTHAFNPMAGICGRTAPVRDALLLAVRARTGDTALGCAQVTTTHLGALSGTLILAHKGIGTLKPGDFANLGGIAALQLDNNDLQTIPAGVFDRLTGLTTLSLHDNRLPSLPDRIFEGLMKLTQLSLNGNPGSADFKPTAMAGPAGGIDVPQGATTGITLGVEVPENGNDDPWGTNVTYAWSRTEGTGGTLTDATAAQAVFTPPATDGTHAFRLTVTGGGGVAGTSTVSVHVGAAGVPPMPVSAVVNGPTLTLTYSKNLQAEPPPASDSGKGQVYLAVVSVPGVRRNIEPVPPSAVEVMGRQVILTFKPSIDPNQVVTLSYFPDNATAESRIRDRGGNLADGFAGLRVDNDTPEGNTVQSFAFVGPAKTYRIGDTIGIDVTFAEAVTVTGAPTLALEIGAVRRKAAYVEGSGSAVLTFEYTPVALGEEDTDGIAVAANGLEVPAGSSILNTADREAAILRHGRYHDPLHKVDGVLPAADAASAAGPTVMVTWSEALDEASVPTGAGGFRVRIGNANGPAVSAVAVSGPTTTLSLASAIADGTANVTLEYTPPRSGAKIRDAAGNDAAAIPRADALAVTVTPDQRAPEVSGTPTVDGTTLTLTFDEALDTASIPAAPGGFTVAVTRAGSAEPGYTVTGLLLSPNGTVVTLTLAQAVRGGDTVTLAYAKPSTPLQDRAATPNEVADFTGADAKAVDNRTPSVKGAPVFAGAAEAYAISERIAVEVEFTQAVSVTTTTSARPEVAVEVGANTRKARYASGSGSARLRFEYAVVAGDADSDGIAIPANALAAPAGSAIRTAAGSRAVQLGHDAVGADAARTVDGLRPTATAAAADGLTVVVTWSEALDPASAGSDAGGFGVKIGSGNGPAVTAVAVDGTDATKLRLTLDDRIADGTQNVTLEYRLPSGAKVRDAAGNDAEGFTGSDAVAVSVTPDTTAPMVTGAAVDGARLTLTFDEPLDEASVPAAPGGFTVTVTRVDDAVPGHTVSGIAVSGATVTLTLAQGVLPGDTVTLDYVPTSTRLQDRAVTPNPVAGFSGLDMKMVDNASDALEVSLSTTEAVEGDDGTVTLTVAVTGGGTSGVARAIAIAPVASPTAAETEDWTLPAGQRSLTLGAGQRSVSAAIAVVDDARLEGAETVSFAVTADGAAIGQVTLTIADDDKAVLAVRGPAQVTEGQPIELTLRLEPHPENVANVSAVPDDACILDFPVTATLTRAGDIAAALPSNPTLETDHTFAAAAFDDCTREVTVSVPTKASDGVWMADRALTFALAPKNSDSRRARRCRRRCAR